ncbi:MAG: hypothetical protein GY749_13135 [Desulfobacteraceae bacterium]|nr:hypothetical protein [Desulfobacteraceae bacterium]
MASDNVIEIRIDVDADEEGVRNFSDTAERGMGRTGKSVSDVNTMLLTMGKSVGVLAVGWLGLEAAMAAMHGIAQVGMDFEDSAAKIQVALGISRKEAENFALVARPPPPKEPKKSKSRSRQIIIMR